MSIEEHDMDDERATGLMWQKHPWTTQEARFAQQMLQHGNHARAYTEAFGNADTDGFADTQIFGPMATVAGQELAARPYMHDYLEYIRAKIKQRMDITKERILEELAGIGFANMADFFVIQKDGTPVLDLSGLSREQLAAVSEMTVDTYFEGRGEDAQQVKSVKVKLAPKLGPLELLGKNQKLWNAEADAGTLLDIATEVNRRRQARRKARETEEDETNGNATDDE